MKKIKIKELIFFLIVILLAIILELAFDSINIRNENIYLFFILAVFVIIIETKNLHYGIMGSIVLVLSYNFFITEPKLTFRMNDPNYYVSFAIFIVVALVLNSLVIQLQKQILIAETSSKRVKTMYDYSSDLLNAKDKTQIINTTISILDKYLDKKAYVILKDNLNNDISIQRKDINSCLNKNRVINISNNNKEYTLFPIISTINTYGVLAVDNKDLKLNEDEEVLITNIIEEMIVALDKDYISNEQQKSKIQIEKEKFKTSLLRGLSHDIKTPLTMIQSGSNFLSESFDQIDDESKINIINDIYNQSNDLSSFVNNLLDMTRLTSDNKMLNCKMESVDEILAEVNEKVKKRLNGIKLTISQSKKSLMVYVDASLLVQVFVNLIENAIKHGKTTSEIKIDYYDENDYVIFKVIDNGVGIKESIIDKIFEDFYSLTTKQDKQRSNGLGLGICKAIIENHKGTITAKNNEKGGAVFEFSVPNKEIKDE